MLLMRSNKLVWCAKNRLKGRIQSNMWVLSVFLSKKSTTIKAQSSIFAAKLKDN